MAERGRPGSRGGPRVGAWRAAVAAGLLGAVIAGSVPSAGPMAAETSPSSPTSTSSPGADLPAACQQKAHVLCISKSEKRLRYLENGAERLSAEVRFGRVDYETPAGTWRVESKAQSTWWSYPFKVFMPWGMKFDLRDGLYVHYSSGFSLNPTGYIGSHGCVQLGDWETARRLYQQTPVGTTVHIY